MVSVVTQVAWSHPFVITTVSPTRLGRVGVKVTLMRRVSDPCLSVVPSLVIVSTVVRVVHRYGVAVRLAYYRPTTANTPRSSDAGAS